ncbi:uncharacterized protein LOC111663438 [Seriola lalandi dorsalis]|uniref:uncharacterized protein LOC111663438 n=1 Tax=Seriola lalandi dorsalis TaxID=1841481 RepID=UPI000C6F700E|nr:uncharacterized protein LOC111663438 [Seriola lalandi dorsalis]
MDNLLIDFWHKHECLFNSSADSYYDKDLKTKLWTEFALSIGKPVSDVERRSRSLRTQYGRVLWHPERVSTAQQKMLREKLHFLRPYIVRRRSDSYLEEKFDDQEEDDEELETEGSFDQEMGSSFGSPLDADVSGQDLSDEYQSVSSTPNLAPLHCPNPQPQVTEVISLSCPHHHNDESSDDQPTQRPAPNTPRHDLLNHFAEVMLADMQQIQDPMVLMRLRRDITDLVFKAVEEDVQRQRARVPSMPVLGESTRSCSRPQQSCSQTDLSWGQRFMKRKNKGSELGRRVQRWEEIKHMRRVARSQLLQPVQQDQAPEGVTENGTEVILQTSEIKRETEPHTVKTEAETLPLA